jgi:RNA-directed DNA polymerase
VTSATARKEKYVLDADIHGCFDAIAHRPLLDKLATYPALRRTIKGWLKAGMVSQGAWQPTERGTPQGGVASPLLANIALHGLEGSIHAAFARHDRPQVIRYADDFVILLLAYTPKGTVRRMWTVLDGSGPQRGRSHRAPLSGRQP